MSASFTLFPIAHRIPLPQLLGLLNRECFARLADGRNRKVAHPLTQVAVHVDQVVDGDATLGERFFLLASAETNAS